MSFSKQIHYYWLDYLTQLDRNPVTTKAITASVISVLSDITAQLLSGTRSIQSINTISLLHQAIIGLVIRGPIVHYWYIILDKIFNKLGYNSKQQDNSTTIAIMKVLLDQTIFSIPFNALYFYAIGALENRTLEYTNNKLSNEFVTLMVANWKIWPLVNIVNFKFIPANLRVLFGNFVGFLWGM